MMGMCCKSQGWMIPVIAGAGVAVGVAVGKATKGDAGVESGLVPTSHASQPETEMPPEMLAWMEAGTPDAHHEELGRFVGQWESEATFQMAPGAPEETSFGRQTGEMIFDGRFVRTRYEGDFGGRPFEGMSLMGYDKIQKKYVSIWVDSFSTMIYADGGSYDESSQTFTMKASFTDPMGQKVRSKHVFRFEDANRFVMEMHQSKDGGEWHQHGTIVYTRR